MSQLVSKQRRDVLDAIDRRRDESNSPIPARAVLDMATPRALRRLASSLRAAGWTDRTQSAEEAAEFEDPGWAPSATLRAAALIDHLSELNSPTGGDVPVVVPAHPALPVPAAPTVLPEEGWSHLSVSDLKAQLDGLAEDGREAAIFDSGGACIARATSWRGEIVEIVHLASLDGLIEEQRRITNGSDDKAKKSAKAEIERLKGVREAWGHACVRAGFARPHLGPGLTAEFFERHVVGRERLDVTVDVNAIVYGIVHHIARIAPHVDFARSAITDLEIQRLADHEPDLWRKACRAIERFPVPGPAWRTLGLPDTTALLVARADQKGKAAGADALLAHNFEEALLRAHGIRCVLLTGDNGLARTVAARIGGGSIWVGYVDPHAPTRDSSLRCFRGRVAKVAGVQRKVAREALRAIGMDGQDDDANGGEPGR